MKKITFIIVVIGLFAFVSSAHALTYQFGQKLSGGGPDFANIATLEVTLVNNDGDGVANDWQFNMQVHDLSIFGAGAFIGTMAIDATRPSTTTTTDTSGVSIVEDVNGGGPGSLFDFRFDQGTGGASDRLTSGETVGWIGEDMGTILGIDGFAALHIQSTAFNPDSVWYISPVPEPETYAMLLIGLGLVGFAARRRRSDLNFA